MNDSAFLGQVPVAGQQSWTRDQVVEWVKQAATVINRNPSCNRPIYGWLVTWLAANPSPSAIYNYAPEDPAKLNEIFLCDGAPLSSVLVKLAIGAVGLGIAGAVIFGLANPGRD
jgi:hypothetical protein